MAADSTAAYPPRQVEDLPPLRPQLPVFYATPPELSAEPYRLKAPSVTIVEGEPEDPDYPRVVEGYRVQLFAGRERKAAEGVMRATQAQYEYAVYMVYEAPQYKVRIGDFVGREEAAGFCERLRREGYSDAWVVKSNVSINR